MLVGLSKLIGHYLFIQISMIIFIAPFYYFYRRSHYKHKNVKVDINRHLELFFGSNYANYLVFFWALGETLIWFVIPEFLLLLIIFMRVSNKRKLLMFDIYGTTTGIVLALVLGVTPQTIAKMPYITEAMVSQAQVWFANMGTWALIHQPFSGVPFKVFTHLAAGANLFILGYILFAIIVRISRYAVAYFVLEGLYNTLHKYIYHNYVKLFFIAGFIFTLLLLRVVSIYDETYEIVGSLVSTSANFFS